MGTEKALRQLLKSLCDDSHWRYAIFWKLKHQSQMLLTWEDGYYNYPERTAPVGKFAGETLDSKNGIFSSNRGTSMCSASFDGDPIGMAVADMSRHQYTLGEGAVGVVAYTGMHCWVLYDDTFAGYFESNSVTKYPDEWLLQFGAGIKTILLASVPHGVVQLGSSKMLVEDMALVSHIKERFKSFHDHPQSLQLSISMGSLDKSTTTTGKLLNKELDFEDLRDVSIELRDDNVSAFNQVTFVDKDERTEKVLDRESKFGLLSTGFANVTSLLDYSVNAFDSEMVESNTFKSSGFEEELYNYYPHHNFDSGAFGEPYTENVDPYLSEYLTEEPYIDKDSCEASHRSASNSFEFPLDSELPKALGPAVFGQIKGCLWDSSASGEDARGGPSLICSRDLTDGIQPQTWESNEWFAERGDVKQLLEAVVPNVYSNSENATPFTSNSIWSSTTSVQFNASEEHCLAEENLLMGDDFVSPSCMKPAFVAMGSNTPSYSCTSATSFKSMMTTLIDEDPQKNGHELLQPKKLANVTRRKAKTCNNHRQRPRDRQMIQDRIKELRKLVPDSSRCSIDSLLDRTAKHMLFLKSVTVQAEKLRQLKDEEVASRMNNKYSKTEDECKNGISWAFELGTKLEVCPIIVEDLEHPGHLLIEMICNDHKQFLEIAQVIHNLELTILRGVVESRLSNTWAHFVVEASKGFHRVDIFLPLMQLLQRNKTPAMNKV